MGQNIEVTHLNFSYEKENPILKDISFAADGQASIGVVGANGAGKSTLLKLLVGLYSPIQAASVSGMYRYKKRH